MQVIFNSTRTDGQLGWKLINGYVRIPPDCIDDFLGAFLGTTGGGSDDSRVWSDDYLTIGL